MTYRKAMEQGQERLANAGIAEARTDSWLLLTTACKIDHTFYYMHMDEEMSEEQSHEFESLVEKRCERIPLQYITGEQEFMGLKFAVNSSVLIPRQDTETLVEEALKRIRPGMRVLDLCTGSGCILISILKNVPDVEGYGYDISKQALAVAKENAKRNEVAACFERSDLFDDVTETFDVIVSNPPYIPTGEIAGLEPEVAEFEPPEALDGSADGLHYYRRIVAQARDYLHGDGCLLVEIGCDQAEAVSRMMRDFGYRNVTVIRDLARRDRVVIGQNAPLTS